MKKNRGFKAEAELKKLFNVRNVLHYKVFADEGNTDPNGGNGTGDGDGKNQPLNFEQLIAKAREEEKNKLYPQIEKLKNEKAEFVKQHNDDLIKIGTHEQTIAKLQSQIDTLKAQSNGGESEAIKNLQEQLDAKTTELESLKKSIPDEAEISKKIREQVEAEYEVKFYRERKINEAGGKIIPELVVGNTNEEIDASYENAVKRYNEIAGSAVTPPSVNPQNIPAGNPASKPSQIAEEAMKNFLSLDPASPEYAEARKKLGLR